MEKNIALNRAAAICSKSEKCIQDIQKKLKDWDLTPSEITEIIQNLIANKFIDESRYAHSFVHDKFHFNKWGKIKIAYELRMRKIPNHSIQTAINKIDETEYKETLSKLIKDKRNKVKTNDSWRLRCKLLQFAQSRGFEQDLALKIIDSFEI